MSDTNENSTILNETPTTSSDTTNSSPNDWKASLPDDLKSDKTLESVTDVTSLAKGYVSAQRMLGGRIPIPSQDASKEVKDEFYSKVTSIPNVLRLPDETDPKADKIYDAVYDKLGRPKSPDAYTVEIPETLKDMADEDYIAAVKATAHKYGLNQKQLDALAKLEISRTQDMLDLMKRQKDNTLAFLKQEWGNTFDSNKNLSKAVFDKYARKFPNEVAELRNSTAGNNPVIMLMASELGKIYQEAGTIAPRDGVSGGRTPEEARAQIADIRSNKAHPYFDERSAGHKEAVAKVEQLYKDAYPDQKQVDL